MNRRRSKIHMSQVDTKLWWQNCKQKRGKSATPASCLLNCVIASTFADILTPQDLLAPHCCVVSVAGLPFCPPLCDFGSSGCEAVIQSIEPHCCSLSESCRRLCRASHARIEAREQVDVHAPQIRPTQVARSRESLKVPETDTERTSGGRGQLATNVSVGADRAKESAKTFIVADPALAKHSFVGTLQFFQRDITLAARIAHHVDAVLVEPSAEVFSDQGQYHVVLDDSLQTATVSSCHTHTVHACRCAVMFHTTPRPGADAFDAKSSAKSSLSTTSTRSSCRPFCFFSCCHCCGFFWWNCFARELEPRHSTVSQDHARVSRQRSTPHTSILTETLKKRTDDCTHQELDSNHSSQTSQTSRTSLLEDVRDLVPGRQPRCRRNTQTRRRNTDPGMSGPSMKLSSQRRNGEGASDLPEPYSRWRQLLRKGKTKGTSRLLPHAPNLLRGNNNDGDTLR